MRISSSRIQKDNTSKDSNMLKASADISESHPHNFSETLYPTKDTMDDAYTILLPETNSEEKVRLATNFPYKKPHVDNFKSCRPRQQLIDNDECQDAVANLGRY
ncbi:hypothetical protein JHK82_044800 [Glycine max]|nr:hypothetical protein JHK82_044800 [Glycine max]